MKIFSNPNFFLKFFVVNAKNNAYLYNILTQELTLNQNEPFFCYTNETSNQAQEIIINRIVKKFFSHDDCFLAHKH